MDNILELSKLDQELRNDRVQVAESISQRLINLCSEHELFHSPSKEAYITIKSDGLENTLSLGGSMFKAWLRQYGYRSTGKSVTDSVAQDVVQTLMGRAIYEGVECPVFFRIAHFGQKVYLDLANSKGEVVEIDEAGWRVMSTAPVKFRRSDKMMELPTPVKAWSPSASIEKLKKFLNFETEGDFRLYVAWLVASIGTPGPFIVLILYGEQGTAKSTTVKVLRSLIDPNESQLRRPPRNTDDLMVAAKSNYVVAIDNMSRLPDWLSDDLCVLSTGGGLSKRKLFSDDEEILLDAKRPIIANGIDEFVARGDLASRSIVISLPKIDGSKRRAEKDFWHEFEEAKSEILGCVFDAVSCGLRNSGNVSLSQNPRMADAWQFITGAEKVFGWPVEACLSAFNLNQLEANHVVLGSSTIYPFIKRYAQESFQGTAQQLLEKMRIDAPMLGLSPYQVRYLPANAKSLSDSLRRLMEPLRLDGIDVEHRKTNGSNSQRIISLSFRNSSVACDASVAKSKAEQGLSRCPLPPPQLLFMSNK